MLARIHPLGREITLVLTLKVVALIVLANLFFAASDRPALTDQALNRHLLSQEPATTTAAEVKGGSGK